MSAPRLGSAARLSLAAPILFLILAATAIPIQLRPPRDAEISTSWDDIPDIVANVLLYVPLGIVVGGRGLLRATLAGTALTVAAESAQLVMLHRDPSVVDVMTNIAGAAIGGLIASGYPGRWRSIRVDWRLGAGALVLAAGPFGYIWSERGLPVSPRGVSEPGTLEAAWNLARTEGRSVPDASGHALAGRFRRDPTLVAGPHGGAAVFARRNSVNFGRSTALRLEGSMTITAWIDSSSYPYDDAAIVSSLREIGYQLDTTIDRGPRTVGFKLSDACGRLMARYGRTPLALNTWYHVAGVYDASAQTLHVYVNGRLDDGDQVGRVSRNQRSSRGAVYVGRRANSSNFNFTGAIGAVRIYSFALSQAQVLDDMRGEAVGGPTGGTLSRSPAVEAQSCAVVTDREEKDLPFASALAGTFLTLALIGLWPARASLVAPALSLAAGVSFILTTGSTLPAFNLVTLPSTALAASITLLTAREARPDVP